ncbi:MAG: 2-oxo acid dehydrogenase subunit E2 [Planctomycetes bacterium]|nr:2-oxo acid dehydrogenase subunit E2 [Planctomycetota bacterium]
MSDAPKGTYRRSPERGFRKLAMAFWRAPNDGTIYGHQQLRVKRALQFQDDLEEKFGIRPSIGMLMGRAVAVALTETPEANSKIIWGQAYIKDTVDVYYQVDLGDGTDLSGVVVADVGKKTILEVAKTLRDRAGKLHKGEDVQYEKTQKGCLSRMPSWILRPLLGVLTFFEYNLGLTPSILGAQPEPFGTVMVTNVSMFGIDVAYAPLIPVARVPLIALVGAVVDTAIVVDGEVVVEPCMNGSATFDHRVLDGNKIGRIVRRVKAYMEDPYAYEAEALGLEVPPPTTLPLRPTGQAAPASEPDSAAESDEVQDGVSLSESAVEVQDGVALSESDVDIRDGVEGEDSNPEESK